MFVFPQPHVKCEWELVLFNSARLFSDLKYFLIKNTLGENKMQFIKNYIQANWFIIYRDLKNKRKS